jgi:predicted RNase H-like HicB family nuclease
VFRVEIEQETDGRWLAEIIELPGAVAYGQSRAGVLAKAKVVALRTVADRLNHGETGPDLPSISFGAF